MRKRAASRRLVALDFETAAPHDHVVEVGCVEIVNGRLTGKVLHELVRPAVPITSMFAAIHGVTDSHVARMPAFAQVADRLMKFLDGAAIVAHAEWVERNILMKELARLGRAAPDRDRFVCTLGMARRSKQFVRNGLRDVCWDLGIDVPPARDGFHDALADARMSALIYLRLAEVGATTYTNQH